MNFKTTFIGLIFTTISLISIPTFILPIVTMIPIAFPLELIYSNFFGNEDCGKIGNFVICSLTLIFIFTSYYFFKHFSKTIKIHQKIDSIQFAIFLTLQLFIFYPLVFYVNSSRDWTRAKDGQFIFGIADTFPISSLIFVFFGIFAEIFRKRQIRW